MHSDNGRFARLPDPAENVRGFLNGPAAEPEPEGISLDDLAVGATLEVETAHHVYHLQNLGDGRVLICGHPEYCPDPIQVDMIGSTWGGYLPRLRFFGKGARLEFYHPVRGFVRTSHIVNIRELKAAI